MVKMRNLLVGAVALAGGFTLSSFVVSDVNVKESQEVYVCNGNYATKYHYNPNCKGLSKCKGGITKMTKAQAESMGRTLCGYED